jgi:hypothetical protein
MKKARKRESEKEMEKTRDLRALLAVLAAMLLALILGVVLVRPASTEVAVNKPLPKSSQQQATAQAASSNPQWIDGNISGQIYNINCPSQIQNNPYQELETQEYVGYLGNLDLTYPRVGDVYYAHIMVGTTGNNCSGTWVHVEVKLPPNTQIATSQTNPVNCWFTSSQGGPPRKIQECPQNPQSGSGVQGTGWYSLDPNSSPSHWPLAQGALLEIQFPVVSSAPLKASSSNPPDLLRGAVQTINGWDYGPKQGVFVAEKSPTNPIGNPNPGGSNPGPPKKQCEDSLDNDKDGKIDVQDPDCASATDDTESPDPGSSNPGGTNPQPAKKQCEDGKDNDGDGKIDFDGTDLADPDPDCTSKLDDTESPDPGGTNPGGTNPGGTNQNTAPKITDLRPAGGSTISNRSPLIRAVVRDTETDLKQGNIKLFVDGKARTFSYKAATDRLRHTSNKLSLGRHKVRIEATDASGLKGKKTSKFKVVRRH